MSLNALATSKTFTCRRTTTRGRQLLRTCLGSEDCLARRTRKELLKVATIFLSQAAAGYRVRRVLRPRGRALCSKEDGPTGAPLPP
eukprot:scaffold351_cov371-Prasinococcus_capsulatus_cf.AAC.18